MRTNTDLTIRQLNVLYQSLAKRIEAFQDEDTPAAKPLKDFAPLRDIALQFYGDLSGSDFEDIASTRNEFRGRAHKPERKESSFSCAHLPIQTTDELKKALVAILDNLEECCESSEPTTLAQGAMLERSKIAFIGRMTEICNSALKEAGLADIRVTVTGPARAA